MCEGDEWLWWTRRDEHGITEWHVPCIGCCCQICGKPGAGPECGDCFTAEDAAAVRREDR
jgi:hypothetical protein